MAPGNKDYTLDEQIGFLLRKANQRHTGIFSEIMPPELTPMRFAAMAKLLEQGALSQNQLGRLTAMDVATTKGVVDRLMDRKLVKKTKDISDARRQLVELTPKGKSVVQEAIPLAAKVSEMTVKPLSKTEAAKLVEFLSKTS